jgi:hypothetical protein
MEPASSPSDLSVGAQLLLFRLNLVKNSEIDVLLRDAAGDPSPTKRGFTLVWKSMMPKSGTPDFGAGEGGARSVPGEGEQQMTPRQEHS